MTATTLPLVNRMSLERIILEPGAIREPQWNVNANQISYVVRGRVLVSTLGNADSFSTFVVEPGQMYHVESGAVYHIENVGDQTAEIIAALRNERPQHFSLHNSVSAMTDNVLGNCYDLPGSAFAAQGPARPESPCTTKSIASSPVARSKERIVYVRVTGHSSAGRSDRIASGSNGQA